MAESPRPAGPTLPTVVALRCQLPDGLLAIGEERPRLSWRVAMPQRGANQRGYEIQVSATPAFEALLATSGHVTGEEQIGIPAPGEPLRSREVRYYRVRVLTDAGGGDWSGPLRVEAGLLHGSDWLAQAITLPGDPGMDAAAPAPCLRREFDLTGEVRHARLYVTSLGVHQLWINGARVGDQLLSPGWTTYRQRLLADTHDVTELLRPGANAVVAVLGDGWYRGRLGWEPDGRRCHFGSRLGLVAQLESVLADGRTVVVVSDSSWRASTAEIRAADLYDGAVVDLRERRPGWDRPGFDDATWQRAEVVPFDPGVIEPRMSPPVREVEARPARMSRREGSVTRLDGGQNLAGFVRLRVRGTPDDRVTIRHAEVVEPDGALHTRSLRSARATDEYLLADGEETNLEPPFTFHGFRYADVHTTAHLVGAEVVSISSDLPRRSRFACSDPRLNQLHENVVWSQRANFVSLPTDCPQRDERFGWTGDAQAFAPTACTLFECDSFWQSWLRDLELDQDDQLGVPSVVPDVVISGDARYGRGGWADAATIVPWAVYESYGDPEILRRQLGSMKRWVDSLVRRQGPDGLLPSSMQFGDWLDPDAPPDRPWEAKTDSDFIANAFFAHSARLLSEAAGVLGDRDAEDEYRSIAERVAASTWARWAGHAVTTQTGCALALQFAIAPARERGGVSSALARLVRDAEGRVATGFVGTPLVLPALADAGRMDEAYQMLLRDEVPSWLYQIARGATTVWERWDAIRPDGSIHPGKMSPLPGRPDTREGHMLSFNHYAYGAAVDWVYRHVAGLAPDRGRPGYRHVSFAPQPAEGITWARASVDSAFGTVSISWRIADSVLGVEVELPFGTSGTFIAPATSASAIDVDGERVPAGSPIALPSGAHSLTVTRPAIALRRPPRESPGAAPLL